MRILQDEQKGVADFVNSILEGGVAKHASDIHIDLGPLDVSVRYRIDGVLYPADDLPHIYQEEAISRIKVLAKMDIAERRFPQDGNFGINYDQKNYNIRVSTIPGIYGESVVMRVLNREDTYAKLDKLGFDKEQLKLILKIISSPHSMVLISGPTGSGKTTLLYSILDTLNEPAKNIITVEDPVELEMPRVRQIQVNDLIDLTFAKITRSILRQDPDIVMLGEIRDADTAQNAFRAALSGVLVFSTFHTFDVPGLVIRLVEMGIPRSVIAYGTSGVVATRLIRKICNFCEDAYEPSDTEKAFLGDMVGANYRYGKGCNECHNSGYLGRTGIYEIVQFDDEIRAMIIEGATTKDLQALFAKKIKKSLRDSALEKVTKGISTPSEAIRIIGI